MSQASLELPAQKRLPDLCAEAFALAIGLRASKAQDDADGLRTRVHELFERFGQCAREAGIDSRHQDQARYALCALLDEIVLTSPWSIKEAWISQPLQMAYFQDFTAGEQFYQRLEQVRGSSDPGDVNLLEVYAQCLAMGFRGKYADLAGMQKISALIDQLSHEIRTARGQQDHLLSEPWERREKLPERVKRIPAWAVAAGCVGFLLILLLILDAVLASQASELLSRDWRPGR